MKTATMKKRFLSFFYAVVGLMVSMAVAHADPSHLGKEFYFAFPQNHDGNAYLSLQVTGPRDTQGTLDIPGLGYSTTFSVTANQITVVEMPRFAQLLPINQVSKLALHVAAQDDVGVVGVSIWDASSAAFMVLPVNALGKEYYSLNYSAFSQGYPSEAVVVGTVDNTHITVTPALPLFGHPAGVPFTIALNRGDAYSFGSLTLLSDATGTHIVADAPIAIVSSVRCANIPLGTAACDHVAQMMPPVSTWGTQFVTVPLALRLNGDVFRVLASENSTAVSINGNQVATLNRGEFYETVLTTRSQILASAPVLVAQFSTSASFDNVQPSDPSMILVPPTEQFLNQYVFSTAQHDSIGGKFNQYFSTNFINVVVPTPDIASLQLDGAPVDPLTFSPIGSSGFSGAQLSIGMGKHTMASTTQTPFGVIVYGSAIWDAYGYPAGMTFKTINPGDINAPTVQLVPFNDTVQGTTTDDLAHDSGISTIELLSGTTNLQLVSLPFLVGAPSAQFTITRIDNTIPGAGTVRVTDGAGNKTDAPVSIIGVPSLKNVRVVATLSSASNDLDVSSFTKPPFSVTDAPNQKIVEWRYIAFNSDAIADLGFDIVLKDPVSSEKRLISQQVDLYYDDINGLPVHTQLASTFVDVYPSVYQITSSTDKAAYGPNEVVQIASTITNLSTTSNSPAVKLSILDGNNVLVAALGTIPAQAISGGGTIAFSGLNFSTGNTYIGNYSVLAEVVDGTGKVLISASSPFTIVVASGPSAKGTITTDKQLYSPTDTVRLATRVTNLYSNAALADLRVSTTVTNPNGSVRFTTTETLPQLSPAALKDYMYSVTLSVAAAGQYSAALTISKADGTQLAQGSAQFAVSSTADTGAGLSGTLLVTPGTVNSGQTVNLAFTTTNNGNSTLVNVPLTVSIVDPVANLVVATIPTTATLAAGGALTSNVTWVASGAAGGTYVAALSATVGTNSIALAQTSITVLKLNVSQSLSSSSRVLALISCNDGENDAGETDLLPAACTTARAQAVDQALTNLGVTHSVVTTATAFRNALSGGIFNTFWISGKQGKLLAADVTALNDAVVRGGSLLLDGVHSQRNQILDNAAGWTWQGMATQANLSVSISGSLLGAATIATVGNAAQLSLNGGAQQGVFQGAQPDSTGPAIVSNVYGAGHVLGFGFDLVSSLQSQAQWQSALNGALQAMLAVPGATVSPNSVLDAKISIVNQGPATNVVVKTVLPVGSNYLSSTQVGTYDANSRTVTWTIPLALAQTVNLQLSLQVPATAGDASLQTAVATVINGNATAYGPPLSQLITVTAPAQVTPNAFSFAPVSNAERGSIQTTAAVTVAGINVPVPISIVGGSYSINGGTFTANPGTVNVGDTVTLRQTASSLFNTTTSTTLTIGTVSATFDVTTLGAITVPSAFTFTPITNAALGSVQTSNSVTIGAINTAVPISIAGGMYSVNGGAYSSSAGMVNAGDIVTVRQTASSTFNTKTTATLTVSSVSGTFDVTTLAAITTPSAFSFTAVTNAALNSIQTSNAITVAGINTSVPISVVGGTYSLNGGAYTGVSGTVNPGDVITLRQTASSVFSTKTTATLTTSTVSANFDVTTLAAITTPSAFSFTAVTSVPVSSTQTSNPITVGGINTSVPISVTGGTYSVNGGVYTSSAGTVNAGDTVAVRQVASSQFATKTVATLTISTVSANFEVTTAVARTTPDPIVFTSQTGVALNTAVTSNTVTVTGLDIAVPLSISGGTYSLNGGAFTAAAGSVKSGDTISVRLTSSASTGTKTTATLTVGTSIFNFDVTTTTAVTTPNAFSFTSVINAATGSVQTSNVVTITGINVAVPISVTGGSYAINGGVYSNSAGTVNPNDMVSVRQTASSQFATKTTAVLTIGGVSGNFDVTTAAAQTTPGAFTFTTQTNVAPGAVATSNAITVTGINTTVPISITGGTYSVNGGAFGAAAGTVKANDVVTVKVIASNSYSTTTTAVLTISNVSGSFSVTTQPSPMPTVLNELNRDSRVLVLLSCENSQGSADPTCLAQRKSFMTTYLGNLGVDFKLVTDTDSFKSEFRCGRYNTYWIAGGAAKLKDNLALEIKEAVFRGDSLIVDGTHDNRNSDLDDILGVKFTGNLQQATSVQLTSALLPTGSIGISGSANKVTLTTGTSLAAFNSASGNPAIVENAYGQGKGLAFLFDWVGTLQSQSSSALLTSVMNQSLSVAMPVVPASVVGDSYVPLDTKIVNSTTAAQSVDVIATVPTALAAIAPIVPAPASTVTSSGNTVYTWHLTIPGQSTQYIDWAVRAPSASGSYTITYQAKLISGSTSTALTTNNVTVLVQGADQGATQTISALQALSLTANPEKSARDKAVTDIQTANTKLNAGMYEDAVSSYLSAVSDLTSITSVSTLANEIAIDRLLQEAGRKWCRAGASCPVSPAGLPTAYNVTVFGSASFSNGQSAGAIGVGGAATLGSYTVGANQTGDLARLIVGGSLSFSNGSVGQGASGVIKVAGSASVAQNVGRADLKTATIVEDWVALKAQYTAFADSLASQAGTPATIVSGNQFNCTGSNPDLNVCTITGSQLTNARTLNLNYPNTATVLVNVTGSAAATVTNGQVNWNGQALSGSAYASRVVFNFAQATGLTVNGFGIGGMILAPRASLAHSNSLIDGQVIVNSLSSTASYSCGGTFQGSLPVVP